MKKKFYHKFMGNKLKLIPIFLLSIEGVLSFYKYVRPVGLFGPNILDIIIGFIFISLAVLYFYFEGVKLRVLQWMIILFSLIFGPGGFIGLGGVFALLLAIAFTFTSKKNLV